jgi:hypothetical protein
MILLIYLLIIFSFFIALDAKHAAEIQKKEKELKELEERILSKSKNS